MANYAIDLQRLINDMAAFSLQWGLVVKKTEIMMFNKSGGDKIAGTYKTINLKTVKLCLLSNTNIESTSTKSQINTLYD